MLALRRDKIRHLACHRDFDDLSLIQTAEIEDFAQRIVGESFRNEILLRRKERPLSSSNDGKIPVHLPHKGIKTLRALKLGERRTADRIESLAHRQTLA